MKPAQAAFRARFAREVDPNSVLPLAERARRAELARRAYFLRLALKSASSRRARSKQYRQIWVPIENTSDATSGGPNQATAVSTRPGATTSDADLRQE
jgi:hypothetical protein